ncbi:MAG: hypothetical protein ACLTJ5_00025 [Clostridium sp.]
MMSDELKQVDVRLKLVEGNGVYSDKPITNPQEAISVMADVMAGLDREEVCVINLDSKRTSHQFQCGKHWNAQFFLCIRPGTF